MPRTSNLSDCRKTRIACWSLVPGPRASWSTMTLIFCPAAVSRKETVKRNAKTSLHKRSFIAPPESISPEKFEGRLSGTQSAPSEDRFPGSGLEIELERELNEARIVQRGANFTES